MEGERDVLEEQIARGHRGDFALLFPAQVKERVSDIFASVAGVPADFTRIRHGLEELNRSLRRPLLDPEGTRGDVLEEIFQEVDPISESDAGKSFNGIDAWIDRHSPPGNAHRSRRLFRDFEQGGYEVNQMMTNLTRSLPHYVTSEQFNPDRKMVERLWETRSLAADAVAASEISPLSKMTTPLVRIGMQVSSVSSLKLKNPGAELVEDEPVLIESEQPDMETLMGSVRLAVDNHGTCTIATVLKDHPADQGLASVVGLLYLGLTHGLPTGTSVP